MFVLFFLQLPIQHIITFSHPYNNSFIRNHILIISHSTAFAGADAAAVSSFHKMIAMSVILAVKYRQENENEKKTQQLLNFKLSENYHRFNRILLCVCGLLQLNL